jgi:hypothetical protein
MIIGLIANCPMFIYTLVDFSELESSVWVKRKVYPVFTLDEEASLEEPFCSTGDVEDADVFSGLIGTSICNRAYIHVNL